MTTEPEEKQTSCESAETRHTNFIHKTLFEIYVKHNYSLTRAVEVYEAMHEASDSTMTVELGDFELALMEIYDGLTTLLFGDQEVEE